MAREGKRVLKTGLPISFRPLITLVLTGFVLGGCTSSQAYFSAEHDIASVIGGEIQAATSSVHVAIYTFTNTDVRDSLFDAAAVRGVDVSICADAGQSYTLSDQREALRMLADDAGVDVRVADGFSGGIMHHKFAIIDQHTVLTGSFNYTRSANEINDENLVVLSSPELAARYEQAFQDLWSRCEAL
jgi:mitochondrial cardiolipin hydrolase